MEIRFSRLFWKSIHYVYKRNILHVQITYNKIDIRLLTEGKGWDYFETC